MADKTMGRTAPGGYVDPIGGRTPNDTGPAPETPTPGASEIGGNPTLLAELRVMFPWLDQIGLTPEFFQSLVADAASADDVIVKLRQQPQYKARFLGLWRDDGSIRMTEAQYLQQEDNYRQVLRQYGYGDAYTNASSLVGFFQGDVDPNELKDRLETYRNIKNSGQSLKDAFYVYAGINLTDDDLYQAVVDPAAGQRLVDNYNSRVAASTFDYTTWITRATERGLQRVSETLGQLQASGALTGQAVQSILRTDPDFARTIMDALYTGGGAVSGAQPLALAELLSSFEYAAIGAAARNAGLDLPTKERIVQIRQAGIDRAQATNAYTQFGTQSSAIDDAVRRVTGTGFNQTQFEDASFLGDAAQQGRLQAGVAREQAAGQGSGQFRMDMNAQGRFVQQGFKTGA